MSFGGQIGSGLKGVLITVLLIVVILNVLAGTVGIVVQSLTGIFTNLSANSVPLADLLNPTGVMGIVYGASVLILVILLVLGFMKIKGGR